METTFHYSVLFVLGVGAFAGILGAWLFQRLRIPQVVGYIAIGVAIGETGVGLIDPQHLESLRPFSKFALGIIGLLVGGELRGDTFRKYGRQFAAIMLGEGLLAFVLVSLGTGTVFYFVMHNLPMAVAAGVVLGAIASATDPASTVDVLWEYRARGVLTTSLIAIVALDDALAMTLYGVGKSTAMLLAGGPASLGGELLTVAAELVGSVALGAVVALAMAFLLRSSLGRDRSLALLVGAAMLTIGSAVVCDLDIILASMSLGVVLANTSPRRSLGLFELLRSVAIPVYVLFFVLVGARLNVAGMPGWLWVVVGLYVLLRSAGKWGGAWLGGLWSRAEAPVRRYAGMGLFAQGGVAVGLSILASESLRDMEVAPGMNLGDAIVFTVTATTLCVQVIGPAMAKLAISLAGEVGRNLTEEDVIADLTVEQAMTPLDDPVRPAESVSAIMDRFAEGSGRLFPVVDASGRMTGVVGFEALRDVLPERDAWDWLLAADIMRPPGETVPAEMPLAEAIEIMRETRLDELLVTDPANPATARGTLAMHSVRQRVDEELVNRSGTR